VDQAGNNTYWSYDVENRQTRKTYADSTHWDYTYDAEGRLTSRTDAKDQTTVYQYDAVGNLTNINYPNDADVSFAYDALNRKIQMTDGIGTTTYAYSSCCGLLESEDGPFANDTLYFDYTDAKQLASVTSAFQNVAYTYDNLQRLKTVVGPEGTNTYSYEGAGTVWRNLQLGNGTAVTRQFDDLLRLTNMVNDSASGILSSFAITVDNADQRTRAIREDGTRYDYSYDAIGQLVGAHATLPDQTPWEAYQYGYRYDAAGNPVEQDKNGLVYSNSFNHLNQNVATVPGGSLAVLGRVNYAGGTVAVNSVQAQLSPVLIFAATGIPFTLGTNALNTVFTDPFGRSTNRETSVVVTRKAYQYDANGNLTNDSRLAYFWNDENRLVAVRSAKTGALIQENRYDGLGRRRERIQISVAGGDDPGSTNRYLYQNWLVLAVTDGTGNVLETYTHGADLSGQVGGDAGGIGGILATTESGTPAFCHYDFNGNVVQVSGSNQTQLAKYTYSPFGEVLLKEGAFTPRYQFSTKEYDPLTGLNYYGYRFYSPGLGRWLNRDPADEWGGMNLYAFVANTPINELDIHGLFCFWRWIKGRAAVWTCIPDPPQPDPGVCLYNVLCDTLHHKQEIWIQGCECKVTCIYDCVLEHTGICGDEWFKYRAGRQHPTATRSRSYDAGTAKDCPDCPSIYDGGMEWL
jgi:RHS repeat-associated protein